jgi:acetyl-CoA C-acetyltransferase
MRRLLHHRRGVTPGTGGGVETQAGSIRSRRSPLSNPVITGIARTPIGKYNGSLAPLRAVELGGSAIAAAVERSLVGASAVDEVLFGHVLQAGEGQITARQAAVRGGLPMSVPSVTINKVCLSGMSAIGLAERGIRAGEAKFIMTGGMESMSNAPHVLRELRWGVRIGNAEVVDVMQHDGLFCAFDQCTMGESSDHKNQRLGIGRAEQDEWAARSHQRAEEATANGTLAGEIIPVTVPQRKGEDVVVDRDEGIRPSSTAESLGTLQPAFIAGGTITAGNASQISDGAAAVLLADRDAAEASGAPIVAEILAYGQIGGVDATLHERPAEALSVALKKAGLDVADLDLVEINEAFAAVALWSARLLDIPESKVNVHGGAVALGHPLGATGARLVVTLVNALRARGGGIGAATLCGGGGQGDAIIVKVA